MELQKQGPFSKKVTDLPDTPSPAFSPSDIKSYMQTPIEELTTTFNNAVDKLNEVSLQPTTTLGVQAKFDEVDAQLAETTKRLGAPLKSYGAIGDNITDDTVAFQNAINENDVVFLEMGKTYKISSLNLPNKKVVLVGYNAKIETTTTSGYIFVKGGTSSSIVFLGIDFNNGVTHRITDCTPNEYYNIFGQLEVNNPIKSTASSMNVANFAGQGLANGSAPIGMVFHHYTDGNVFQVDNVGEGNTILTLKNARNALRRGDKPSDYTGSGRYIRLEQSWMDAGVEKTKYIWAMESNGKQQYYFEPIRFDTLRSDDNAFAYQFSTYNAMKNLINFIAGGQSMFGISYDSPSDTLFMDMGSHKYQTRTTGLNSMISYNNDASVLAPSGTVNLAAGVKASVDAPYLEVKNCVKLLATTSANVVNNAIFIDSTTGALKFKDASGVVKTINLS